MSIYNFYWLKTNDTVIVWTMRQLITLWYVTTNRNSCWIRTSTVRKKEVKFVWIFSLEPRFRVRCPYYRGYFYKECMGIFPDPSELSVLERCPQGEVRPYLEIRSKIQFLIDCRRRPRHYQRPRRTTFFCLECIFRLQMTWIIYQFYRLNSGTVTFITWLHVLAIFFSPTTLKWSLQSLKITLGHFQPTT